MERDEARYQPDVLKQYAGEGIVVHWEPKLCIHVAACIRELPLVFDPNRRPWIDVDQADAESIAQAIEQCPTGALRYERSDGALQEQPELPATIQPRLNGPLFVRGEVEVIDGIGRTVRQATRLALCRCGHSSNKPYCDLTHRDVDFKST